MKTLRDLKKRIIVLILFLHSVLINQEQKFRSAISISKIYQEYY